MLDYQPTTDLLQNRVILVTGAGDGIGQVIACALASHGATVILLGRTIRKLEAVYDRIVESGAPKPAIYPMNLEGANPKDYEDMAEKLDEEFGRLDGLLHNASILGTLTPLQNYDISQWYKVLQVNLNAPFMMTQACLPLMKKSTDASILFTSSGVGRKGRAYWGAYSISKFGLEGLMQVLADELETNTRIRVNSLNPGATRTAMRAAAYPSEDPMTLPEPSALLPWYLYLMGPDSQGINGQMLNARSTTLPETHS